MVLEFDIEKDSPAAEELLYGIDVAMENYVDERGRLSKKDIRGIVEDELSRYDVTEFISLDDIKEQLVKVFTRHAVESAKQMF